MFCPECSTNNTDDAQYCVNCGMNLSKARQHVQSNKTMFQNQSIVDYDQPYQFEEQHRTHSPIIDNLEDARIADHRDQISSTYLIISFLFFPIGIVLWSLNQQNKPESAKNILAASVAGFFVIIILLTL